MPDVPSWVRDAVFYQVFPDRFAGSERVPKSGNLEPWDAPPTTSGFKGGDLLGIAEHLDHVVRLGANALYLTPVFMSASNHRYHTYDYLRVDPLLGGNDALRELLDRAHERGVRVILDGVFNHTGRGFWQFHHVLETGGASPYRNWFLFDQAGLDQGRPIDAYPGARARAGVGLGEPVPGAVEQVSGSPEELGYAAWWGLPALPKLNVAEPEVREYLWSVAEHWLRFGIDGWRLDVPAEIDDPPFWNEFRRRCRAVNPEAYLVGEIWHVAPEWVAGDRFDGLMNYPLAEAIIGFAGGSSLDLALARSHNEYARIEPLDGAAFAARLGELLRAYDPATVAAQLNLLGSHDTPRLRSLMGGRAEAVELAVLLQATLPGAPSVYYGDEVGLEGGKDPDSRRAFPWDPSRWEHRTLEVTRSALRLRADEPALRADEVEVLGTSRAGIAYARGAEGRTVVTVNADDGPAVLPLRAHGGGGADVALRAGGSEGDEVRLVETDGRSGIELPPHTGAIVRLR
jgi:neopullulanase